MKNWGILTIAILILVQALPLTAAETHKLDAISKLPAELPAGVAKQLRPEGITVVGPDGPVCDIWFGKDISVPAEFNPTLTVKYPFASGQFLGALRVHASGGFTDFRGQELNAGLYTLRYGRQPEDGNHIGTSETYDFLLALPTNIDDGTGVISNEDELSEKSGQAAGSTHPAILSMLPTEKKPEKPELEHDSNHDFWIATLPCQVKRGDKADSLALRFVVVGRALE